MLVLTHIIVGWLLLGSVPLVGHPLILSKNEQLGYFRGNGIWVETCLLHVGLIIARLTGSVDTVELIAEVLGTTQTLKGPKIFVKLLVRRFPDFCRVVMSIVDQAPQFWWAIFSFLAGFVLCMGTSTMLSIISRKSSAICDAPSIPREISEKPSYHVPTINVTCDDSVTVTLNHPQSLCDKSFGDNETYYSARSMMDDSYRDDSLISGTSFSLDLSFSVHESTYLTNDSIFLSSPAPPRTKGLVSTSSSFQTCHHLAELSADMAVEEFVQGGAVRAIQETTDHSNWHQSRQAIWTWIRYNDLKWVQTGPLSSRSTVTARSPLRLEHRDFAEEALD